MPMSAPAPPTPADLLGNNRAWSESVRAEDPEFFARLAEQQRPNYLWIGCADSRVPANEVVGLRPGELFVHRNVANVVVPTDLNCLSVLQYAVDVLGVEHVIVCGHYGCGGVAAAYSNEEAGLVENWLRHVQDVRDTYRVRLERFHDQKQAIDRLCELNVIEQVHRVGRTTVVENAWKRGQRLELHGWIYSLSDGLLTDLRSSVSNEADLDGVRARAIGRSEP